MALSVSEAVNQRRSVRAFLPDAVPDTLLRDVLTRATRAASGGNLQPWRIYVLNGDSMARFRGVMEARMAETPMGEPTEYPIYPAPLKDPYRARRYDIGEALYGALGIPRDDKFARLAWVQNNDRFFGAPAAAFCFTDRTMGQAQWSDLGMYLQTAMYLFEEAGYATCPQEAWSRWPKTVGDFVGSPAEHMLFCGLAIGRADTAAPINNFRSPRAPVDEIISFV